MNEGPLTKEDILQLVKRLKEPHIPPANYLISPASKGRFVFLDFRLVNGRFQKYKAFVDMDSLPIDNDGNTIIPRTIPDELWHPYYGRWRIVKGKRYRRR